MKTLQKRIIRLPEVMGKTGRSRSSIYADIRTQKFPQPINISERNIGWIEEEIEDWIQSKILESRKL